MRGWAGAPFLPRSSLYQRGLPILLQGRHRHRLRRHRVRLAAQDVRKLVFRFFHPFFRPNASHSRKNTPFASSPKSTSSSPVLVSRTVRRICLKKSRRTWGSRLCVFSFSSCRSPDQLVLRRTFSYRNTTCAAFTSTSSATPTVRPLPLLTASFHVPISLSVSSSAARLAFYYLRRSPEKDVKAFIGVGSVGSSFASHFFPSC